MATKTKIKDSLRKTFLNELKENVEEKRLERVKENAHLKEVTFYGDKKIPYTESFKTFLENEGIKLKAIDISDNPEEWSHIRTITGMPTLPAIIVNKNILMMKRDFMNQKTLLGLIKHYAAPEFKNPDFEGQMIEMTKTNMYNLAQRINMMEQNLKPIAKFVVDLQKQMAEEEKAEKTENEQKDN